MFIERPAVRSCRSRSAVELRDAGDASIIEPTMRVTPFADLWEAAELTVSLPPGGRVSNAVMGWQFEAAAAPVQVNDPIRFVRTRQAAAEPTVPPPPSPRAREAGRTERCASSRIEAVTVCPDFGHQKQISSPLPATAVR